VKFAPPMSLKNAGLGQQEVICGIPDVFYSNLNFTELLFANNYENK